MVRYVGQEPVLFTGSVAGNVSKGRSTTLQDELLSLNDAMKIADKEACQKVNAVRCRNTTIVHTIVAQKIAVFALHFIYATITHYTHYKTCLLPFFQHTHAIPR